MGGGEKRLGDFHNDHSPTLDPPRLNLRGYAALRGGNPPYPHKLSPQQMKVLAAICEAFVPSLDAEEIQDLDLEKGRRDDVRAFYRLSASDMGLASEVAGHMFKTRKHEILVLVGWLLWMLSTRVFTFLLFGFITVSHQFPFVESFPTLSVEVREEALLSFSRSSHVISQKIFKLFKSLTLYCLYAKADENGRNPCWNAIGYSGPDPSIKSFSASAATKYPVARPLDGKVVDSKTVAEMSEEELVSLLSRGGFTVLDDISHLRSLNKQQKKQSNKSTKSREIGIRCDAVVVGSGSGGGVVAGVLARAGHKILILEKGQYYAREDLTLLEGPSMGAMYEGAGTLTSDDGLVSILAGTTVGGGSAINWAASFQTPQHVRQEWAEDHGLSFFTTEEYQQAMDIVWDRVGVQAVCEKESFQNQNLRRGCEALGYEIGHIPRNVDGEHSCGWCNFGCKNGSKQATSETWLVDAVTSGALILSGCEAQAVLHRKKTKRTDGLKKRREAVGVVAAFGEETILYVEARVTVVACGSINSPPLLLRSGLRNVNIGRNLHLHPVIMGWGYFPEDRDPTGTCYEGAIMSAVCRESASQSSSGYGALIQVPALHPASCAALLPWRGGLDHKRKMRKYSRTSHFIVLGRDKGSGRVKLDSGGKTANITYSVSSFDKESLLDGLEKALRAMVAAGAEEVGTHHWDSDTFSPTSGQDLDGFLQRIRAKGMKGLKYPICSAHQLGTCRMGVKESTSVVDEKCETWEVEGLFMGDASVFPTASGVNPMITVQAIAYCTAQNVLVKLQEPRYVNPGSDSSSESVLQVKTNVAGLDGDI